MGTTITPPPPHYDTTDRTVEALRGLARPKAPDLFPNLPRRDCVPAERPREAVARCAICDRIIFERETVSRDEKGNVICAGKPLTCKPRLAIGRKPGPPATPVLPTDSEERKGIPIFSGPLSYFPLAFAALARHCKRGNDKHNPGEPLHWARDKSQDHEDCIARHLLDIDTVDPRTGEYEDAVSLLWRAAAVVQLLEEKRLGKPPSRGSR